MITNRSNAKMVFCLIAINPPEIFIPGAVHLVFRSAMIE
jgi:hypothetical protein